MVARPDARLTIDNRGQPVNNEPFWAQVYLLLRTGSGAEALELVEKAGYALTQRDRPFVTLFRKWYTSPDQRWVPNETHKRPRLTPRLLAPRRLMKDDRDQLMSLWNKHVRNSLETGDPFRYALYKLVGRIEVERKNVRGVTATLEDWMWFQLNMVKETAGAESQGQGADGAASRGYTLKDLGDKVVELGPDYFLSAGTQNNPLVYFQNLVFTGQFEEVSVTGVDAIPVAY